MDEMPSLQRLADRLADGAFAVVAVNVGEGTLRAAAVVEQLGIRFPVLVDKDSTAFARWGVRVLPTTYLLDRQGTIRYAGLGPLEWDSAEVIDLLDRLGGDSRVGSDCVRPSRPWISPTSDRASAR